MSRTPRERRTPYVLLGMLQQGPATGYALRQRIGHSVGAFWQESYGQLYPALEALAARGLVQASTRARDRRDARIFRITGAGRAELAAWLDRPPAPQPERNELLLKLFFSDRSPTAATKHLQAARLAAKQELTRLQALRADVVSRRTDHRARPMWLATIDFGIAGQRALMRWCARTLATLAATPPRRRTRGSRGPR